ncbi:MAG: class I SAM-dependent methyltransferase [Clostridia bacterium]|nr:class I SAM-dependent methyltransferase [Clostridia bacterium]
MNISYSALAGFYDALNAHVDYERIADFYERIFKRFGADPVIVADLACGTGTLTEIMAGRGYDMIGIDNSDAMLNAAQAKRAQSGLDILYLNQDMSSFELYGTVGAVVSSLDSINHLTDKNELMRCFECCHMYLDPGGLFVFDINTPHRFKNVLDGTTAIYETEDVFCAVEHSYDKRRRSFYYDMTLFEKTDEGLYVREDDCVKERAYEITELSDMLYEVGFDRVYVYGEYKFKKPQTDCERAVFAAVKEKMK